MLGTQPALNYRNIQRRAPAHVQALHTSSSRVLTPTLDLYLSVPASEGGESWRVPAKAVKPRGGGWCQGWGGISGEGLEPAPKEPNLPPPPPRVSPDDASPRVCLSPKQQGL